MSLHTSCCVPPCPPSVNMHLLNKELNADYKNTKPNRFHSNSGSLLVTCIVAMTKYLAKQHKEERIYFGSQFERIVHSGC